MNNERAIWLAVASNCDWLVAPAAARLDEIVKTVDASTRAEVIRRALTLYTEVLEAEKRAAKIFFRDPDGTLIQVMPLF